MRRNRRNQSKTVTALAAAFAALTVFTGTASAMVRDDAASRPAPEIPYLSHGQGIEPGTYVGDDALLRAGLISPDGLPNVLRPDSPGGVTPTDLARAYEPRFEGVATPDGHVPSRGEDPLLVRGGQPDGLVSPSPSESVSVSVASDGFDRDDVAIGFGLGLVLATGCAAALAAARGRTRMAHS